MTDVEPWAWVVLVAAYFAIFLNGSFYYSIGVIHIALLDKYQNLDVTTVAWVGSLYSSTMLVTGVLGSVIVNIFNVRTCIILSAILNIVGFTLSFLVDDVRLLMVTFSVIAGCGQAICYTGSMIVIGYYFKEKTSMATGIVTSASGLSLFVFPPLTQYFIDEFGLNGAFLLLGAIGFEVAISGAVMRPTKYETRSRRGRCYKHRSENPQNKLNQDEKKPLYTSLPFWILLLSSMCFGVALSIIYLYLPEYNKQHGSTPQEAAIIMSIVGITGLSSRILLGFLASAVDAVIIYSGIFGIMGIINVMINLMVTFPTKLAYAALFGMYTGGCWSLQHTLVVEVVGLPNLSTAYGITVSFTGIGYLIGPPLAGLIVSTFKVLYYAFLFASLFFFLSSFTMLLMRLLTKQLPQTKVTQVSDVLITEHEEDLYACSQEYDDETTRRGDNIIVSSGELILLTAR